MNPIVRNILAVIAGVFVGMIVNMGILSISASIIPPPEGVDSTDMESLKANMHLFQPIDFLFPFLAHAIGTLAGAYFTARIAATHKMKFALGIGVFFLLGGIATVIMLPSPLWFSIVDLVGAYIPMAWLAAKMIKEN